MATLPLKKVFDFLQKCAGIVVDDGAICCPDLADLTGDDENQFMYFSCVIEGEPFDFKFMEGNNREIEVVGSSLFIQDIEGEDVQITLLEQMNAEPELWDAVNDSRVRHVWKHPEATLEDCQHHEDEAVISPDFYQDNGTPVCPECGDDYVYVRTEVLQ